MSIERKRLKSGESRDAAIEAARAILLESGPHALTLKSVAARVGRTHANLLHHFGSAAGLQSELARSISERVSGSIAAAVERARSGEADTREVVDEVFDAFGREGAGALAAWMILTGNRDALDPVLRSIRDLVAQLSVGHEDHHVGDTTLWLVLLGLGNALLGQPIADALGIDSDTARRIAANQLRAHLERAHQRG